MSSPNIPENGGGAVWLLIEDRAYRVLNPAFGVESFVPFLQGVRVSEKRFLSAEFESPNYSPRMNEIETVFVGFGMFLSIFVIICVPGLDC